MAAFKFARMHPDALAPYKAHPTDAGYDLFSVETIIIPCGQKAIIDTGIAIEISDGLECYARVAPRSGLAAKHNIDVFAGVVDASYRDSIKVILFNHGTKEFCVNKGDRIAQMIFERIYSPELQEVTYEDLTTTERGVGGFGSSGR